MFGGLLIIIRHGKKKNLKQSLNALSVAIHSRDGLVDALSAVLGILLKNVWLT